MIDINETLKKDKNGVKNFFGEFKTFAIKGNVLDLAVGVVIGTAFNSIINSLVNDVIMQGVAMIFGKPDFNAIVFAVNGGEIRIGAFLTSCINFIIVAFSVFLAIKLINRLIPHRNVQETVPASKEAIAEVKKT